ncbi:hypothetical protein OSC27_02625 [Microbacterium sp. STN6]|uniref:hypothetical protein n=1 Tax=Microbacterium sp. STN6 TaxID=2995588 RepID=UPI0022609E26|nr:hypothetical protein [Microbacterium sp. STN6]MCX7521169.1 hypothetical protein [Microbacterium sp. STN6]
MTDPTNAEPEPVAPRPVPSSNAVLTRILKYGGMLAAAIVVVGAILGYIFVGWPGVTSALIGTAMAVVFLSITAISILLGNRFAGSDLFVGAFFGIVLGSWFVKFALFLVLFFALRGQSWLNPTVEFLCLVAGVVGSLVVDVLVVTKSRMTYASDVKLQGEDESH